MSVVSLGSDERPPAGLHMVIESGGQLRTMNKSSEVKRICIHILITSHEQGMGRGERSYRA
jgi:hypothetical protein